MKIELQAPDQLRPYGTNPRTIPDYAVQVVAESIDKFGFRQPIVVDADNVIVMGHTRLKAAVMLGLKEVPTTRISDLSDEDVRALRIADNRAGEISGWDIDLLSEEVRSLEGVVIPGFEDDELETLRAIDLGEGRSGDAGDTLPDRDQNFVQVSLFVPRAHAKEIKAECEKIVARYAPPEPAKGG